MSAEEKPTHKYLYAYDINGPTAPARVARIVGHNKKVLEIGSGPGALTRVLSEVGANRVTALEIDPTAIDIVKNHCEKVVQGDLNSPHWYSTFSHERFDAVVAADVLEHVINPLDVLKGMTELLNPGGCVVVSVPNVSHAAIGALMHQSHFRYGDWGLLDRTHIRFFGLQNVQSLMEQAGLCITHAEFVVKHPDETEFADIWKLLPIATQKALLEPKHSLIYQCVVKAVPLGSEHSTSLRLSEQEVPGWKNPYAVPSTVMGFDSLNLIGKMIRLPGQVARTLGRRLP